MAEPRLRVALCGDDTAHALLMRRLADDATGHRPLYRRQRLGSAPAGYAAVFVEMARELLRRADVALVLLDEDGRPVRRAACEEAERAGR